MDMVTRNLAEAYPDADKGIGAKLVPLKKQMVGEVQPILLVLIAAVGFVLLIACVNVASLLLARSTGRAREFAIRIAMGAGQARLVQQMLTESVLLALFGGALGLLLAHWGTRAALSLLPAALPRATEIGLDARVLAFTIAISVLVGILFGLVPTLRTTRPNLQETLKEGGRGDSGARHRAQDVFVVVEMALALVLLIGAGLLIRSLTRLWNVDPGFNPKNVLSFQLSFPPSMATAKPDEARAAIREPASESEMNCTSSAPTLLEGYANSAAARPRRLSLTHVGQGLAFFLGCRHVFGKREVVIFPVGDEVDGMRIGVPV
jgi:hypothetical protein